MKNAANIGQANSGQIYIAEKIVEFCVGFCWQEYNNGRKFLARLHVYFTTKRVLSLAVHSLFALTGKRVISCIRSYIMHAVRKIVVGLLHERQF